MRAPPSNPSDRPCWGALPVSMRRDLLGVWATLVLELLRREAGAEDGHERQDPALPPGASRARLPSAVRPAPDARPSRVDRAAARSAATRDRAGLAGRAR